MARMIRLSGVAGPEGDKDLPPPNPDKSPAENAAFRARVDDLVYGPSNNTGLFKDQPPKSKSHAESLIANGRLAAAEEAVFFPHKASVLGTSVKSTYAFNEINSTWRQLEAWAGVGLGAEVGYGPFKKNSIAPTYRNWLAVSRDWKSGTHQDTTALESLALDLQKAEKVAHEYGYPGVYHPDRREEKDAEVDHYVHVPGVEDQTGLLGVANTVAANTPKIPDSPGDLFGKIPLWVKIAGGVALFSVVVTPVISILTRPRAS